MSEPLNMYDMNYIDGVFNLISSVIRTHPSKILRDERAPFRRKDLEDLCMAKSLSSSIQNKEEKEAAIRELVKKKTGELLQALMDGGSIRPVTDSDDMYRIHVIRVIDYVSSEDIELIKTIGILIKNSVVSGQYGDFMNTVFSRIDLYHAYIHRVSEDITSYNTTVKSAIAAVVDDETNNILADLINEGHVISRFNDDQPYFTYEVCLKKLNL